MPTNPWDDLNSAGIDSRRIDHAGKWDFFWTIMPPADPALALVLNVATSVSLARLPKLRNIEAGFLSQGIGQTFYLRLKDKSQAEPFETLCRDVVACAEAAPSEGEALLRAVGRTSRWHYLLRGGQSSSLTDEEQKGLIGELTVLEWLADLVGARAAITAWAGPSGAPKDFELHGHCVEVKARRGAAQPYVQISNEFQLADVEGRELWLAIVAVDKVSEPFGSSLDQLVERAAVRFKGGDADIELLWDIAIEAAGYRSEDDYSATRWDAGVPSWYSVAGDFPRLDLPLKAGVADVKYSISLGACQPFKVDLATAATAISNN